MADNPRTVDFAINTILDYVRDKDRRLRVSAEIRTTLGDALARGETPVHYRIDWLRASSERVNDLLQQLALEFNQAHPADMCSVADLMDVLHNSLHRIKRAVSS